MIKRFDNEEKQGLVSNFIDSHLSGRQKGSHLFISFYTISTSIMQNNLKCHL